MILVLLTSEIFVSVETLTTLVIFVELDMLGAEIGAGAGVGYGGNVETPFTLTTLID